MYGFSRISLSRKGFDSSKEGGGGYSPFNPATGKYIVLPIPETENVGIKNRLGYEEIKIKPGYLNGINASNMKELICHKNIRLPEAVKRKISDKAHRKVDYAHFDPWLGHCCWLEKESAHSIGAFGQEGAAQGHLKNPLGLGEEKGVKKGSLFLFFSRFVAIKNYSKDKEDKIKLSKRLLEDGAYFLYGWLIVTRIADCYGKIHNEEIEKNHPHVHYWGKPKHKNNTIYISEQGSFKLNNLTIPKFGYFPELSEDLLLTSKEHYKTPSTWELPAFFYETRPTHMSDWRWCWEKGNQNCFVQAPARGQEFVFDESEEFDDWFKKKLQNSGILQKA